MAELQTINSSGELTEIKLGGTASGNEVLTSDEITTKLGEGFITDYIALDTGATPQTSEAGLMQWNITDGTMDLGITNNITMQVGQELFVKVSNKSGAQITNGSVVYISGRTGTLPDVELADGSSMATSRALGLTTEDIDNNSSGFVTTFGYVRGTKTDYATWSEGDPLWVSTTTPGALTNVEPDAPNYSDIVGFVGVVHTALGSILVNIQTHQSLTELADVDGTPLDTDKQILVWDNSNNYFDFTEVYGKFGDVAGGDYAEFDEDGQIRLRGEATQWEDLRFPLAGQNIDTNAGRVDRNYFNGGLDFATNARYPNEPVSMLVQLPHARLAASDLEMHLHWLQTSANIPNWLIAYKVIKNGDTITKETDFSNHTLATINSHAYSYTSGNLVQISEFGMIDGSDLTISDLIHIVLFRDTANTSGEFGGADPDGNTAFSFEFDLHYQIDSFGSNQEYVKY